MKIHIEIDVEGDGTALNEVSKIITRAMQVQGVKRFALFSDPKTDLLDANQLNDCRERF